LEKVENSYQTNNPTNVLRVPAQIVKVETTSDGGIKLAVITQELASREAEVIDLHNKIGWFLFATSGREVHGGN